MDSYPRSQQESAPPSRVRVLREQVTPQAATDTFSSVAPHQADRLTLKTPERPERPEKPDADVQSSDTGPSSILNGWVSQTHPTSNGSKSLFAYELARTWLMPQAHPSEGSSLTAILGFGETQASFADYRLDQSLPDSPPEPTDAHWRDLPSLSTVTRQLDRPGNTGDAVKLLWEASEQSEPAGGSIPSEFSPVEYDFRSKRRSFRWPMVIGIAVLLALMAATWLVITELPGRLVQEREVIFTESAEKLYGSLAPLHLTLSEGGLLDDSGLAALTDHIHALDEAARRAVTLTSLELPMTWIPGSNQAGDDLATTRRALEEAATRSLEVARRIGDGMAYSLSISEVLDFPDLPHSVALADADVIAMELSRSVAEARSTFDSLPEEDLFRPYVEQATRTMSLLEVSQADYVVALRTGDTLAAARAGDSISASAEDIRSGLDTPLDSLQEWAMMEIWSIDQVVQPLR